MQTENSIVNVKPETSAGASTVVAVNNLTKKFNSVMDGSEFVVLDSISLHVAEGEFADIVCADGWHFDADGKTSYEEREGRSLILTRTEKSEALLQRVAQSEAIATEPTTAEAMAIMQPYQAHRKGFVRSRLAAMALTGKKRPRFDGLELGRNALRFGAVRNIKSMAGMLLRIFRGTQMR